MSLGFLVVAGSMETKANTELLARSCSALGSCRSLKFLGRVLFPGPMLEI